MASPSLLFVNPVGMELGQLLAHRSSLIDRYVVVRIPMEDINPLGFEILNSC